MAKKKPAKKAKKAAPKKHAIFVPTIRTDVEDRYSNFGDEPEDEERYEGDWLNPPGYDDDDAEYEY